MSLRLSLFVFLLTGFSWLTGVGSWHACTQAFKLYWVYFVVFRPTVAHINHNLVEEKHNARFPKRLYAVAKKIKKRGFQKGFMLLPLKINNQCLNQVRFRTDIPLLITRGSLVILNSIKNCHTRLD